MQPYCFHALRRIGCVLHIRLYVYLSETLDQLANQLDPQHFFWASRQCITSVGSISAIHKHFNGRLKLDLNPIAPEYIFVSRERAEALKLWLNH